MPDAMDRIQDACLREQEAMNAVRQPARLGPAQCEECGEPISSARRELGAVRCVDCQTEHEARAAHLAVWGRR